MPGVIAAIQTFGDRINLHPHLHFLVTEGGVDEAQRLGDYMIRPRLSLERLSLDEKRAQVGYRYGKEAQEMEGMDHLEFIARVSSHIPDKG